MGININSARFLLYARTLGVDFTRTATIGRQSLHLSRSELKQAFRTFRYVINDELIQQIFTRSNGYAEQLLTYLGARDVHSFDISAYEGATHLCDLNREVPVDVKEQYTTVLDGGSLEHIFNFPMAIKNCMEMVGVGGHYVGITPANNCMGHGFYQLSPEMYFSIFTRENGFELISMVAYENRHRVTWYTVRSPQEVGDRVTLVNSKPVYLLMIAKRLAKAVIFETTPQQSDYLTVWHQNDVTTGGAPTPTKRVSALGWVKRIVPDPLKRLLKRIVQRSSSGFDSRFFQPLDPSR